MTQIIPLCSFPTTKFNSLISADELLQIQSNGTVSILSARTGFCKYFYFLPQVPSQFYINPKSSDRYVLVYPGPPSTLVILETRTGVVLKQITLKAGYDFEYVAIGSHVFFVLSQNPNILYFTQFNTGTTLSFDAGFKISGLWANLEESQFLLRDPEGNFTPFSAESQPKPILSHPLPIKTPISFLIFRGNRIILGAKLGQIISSPLDANSNPQTYEVPHHSFPIGLADNIGVAGDGCIFSLDPQDEGRVLSYCFSPLFIDAQSSVLAVIGPDRTQIYEVSNIPTCSALSLTPPEPFTSDTFSIDSAIYFSSPVAMYSFNFASCETSNFVSLEGNPIIKRIVSTPSLVSALYTTPSDRKNTRVMTYVTGSKKRDEPAIDLCTCGELTWILESDGVRSFKRDHLSLAEVSNQKFPVSKMTKSDRKKAHQSAWLLDFGEIIPTQEEMEETLRKMDEEDKSKPRFNRIFNAKNHIIVYNSENGEAAFISENGFDEFVLPLNIQIARWPALVTPDTVYIYPDFSSNTQFEKPDINKFIKIQQKVTSCVWLGWTLFAVVGRTIIAIQRTGVVRVIAQLPNTMCSLAAALPSSFIFVTTFPDLRVITLRMPVLFECLPDIDEKDLAARRLLHHLPTLPLSHSINKKIPSSFAMALFSKSPPNLINEEIMHVYTRFGRFNEISGLIRNMQETIKSLPLKTQKKKNQKILKLKRKLADIAKRVGQFETARILYEEIGADEELLELFMVFRNIHNLSILASKSPLKPAIEQFGIQASESENDTYKPLQNIPLPSIKSPIQPLDFTLYSGDEADDLSPLYPPTFDEVADFGRREFPLSSEDAEQVKNIDEMDTFQSPQISTDRNAQNFDQNSEQNQISDQDQNKEEIRERPKDIEKRDDEEMKLNNLFDGDDDDEPEKKLEVKIDLSSGIRGGRRGRGGPAPRFVFNAGNNEPDPIIPAAVPGKRRRAGTTKASKNVLNTIQIPTIKPQGNEDDFQINIPKNNESHFQASDNTKNETDNVDEKNDDKGESRNDMVYQSTLFMDI